MQLKRTYKFLSLLMALWSFSISGQSQSPAADCGLTVNAGPDKLVCADNPVTTLEGNVRGQGLREIEWMPPDGLSSTKVLNPTVTVSGPQCYILTGKKKGDVNLVVNGNFEMGNTGFITDYTLGVMSCYGLGFLDCEGTYAVINNPQLGHANFAPCGDHTSGGGNMMVVNGAPGFVNVWCQTISVNPDHDYCVSAWACSVNPSSPAQLEFTINGFGLGTISLGGGTCAWQPLMDEWNSGSASVATICILNRNTAGSGNDFAIDDIEVIEVCEQYDTVCVDIIDVQASILPPDRVCCDHPIVQLDGSGSSQGPDYTYCWTASNGGHIVSGDMTLYPMVDRPGTYTLMVKGPEGCTQEVEVEVEGNLIPPKAIIPTPDSLDCNHPEILLIGGATPSKDIVEYFWSGPNGFTSYNSTTYVSEPGIYTLTVTDDCGCTGTAFIEVFGKADLLKIDLQSDTLNCLHSSTELIARINRPDVDLVWSGPMGFYCDNDTCITSDTGWYYLMTTTEDGCERLDSIHVLGDFAPPSFTSTLDTISCSHDTARLTVHSPGNTSFEWKKNGSVVHNDSTLITTSGGVYVVVVTGQNGCKDSLELNVIMDTLSPVFSLNGDLIDCEEVSTTLCHDGRTDQYRWSFEGQVFSNDTCAEVGNEGWYLLTAIGNNGCITRDSIFVDKKESRPEPVFSTDTLNCDHEVLILYSGIPNAAISWELPDGSSASGDSLQVNATGWYHYHMTADSFECPREDSLFIPEDFSLPVVQMTADSLTCIKDSTLINLSNTTFRSLHWVGPNDFTSTSAEPLVRSPGVYTVVVVNHNGCIDSFNIEVFRSDDYPVVSLDADTITCATPTVRVSVRSSQDDLRFDWRRPDGSTTTDSSFTTSLSGQYKVSITNDQGCTIERFIDVPIDTAAPAFTIEGADTLDCVNRFVQLSLKGMSQDYDSIVWSTPEGEIIDQRSISLSEGGMVRVSVVGKNGCRTTHVLDIVQDTVVPSLSIQGDTIDCATREVQLLATSEPGIDPFWTQGQDTFSRSMISASTGGAYTAIARGKNGCTRYEDFVVLVDTTAPVLHPLDDTINCAQQEAYLISGTRDEQVEWTIGGSQVLGDSLKIDRGGIYEVRVTGANGCVSIDAATIQVDTMHPVLYLHGGDLTCDTMNTILSFTSTAQGNHSWLDPNDVQLSSSAQISVDQAGIYHLVFVDTTNGCETQSSIEVRDLRDLPIPITEIEQPTCDDANGHLTIYDVRGGNRPFRYFLNDSAISKPSRSLLPPGRHIIRIEDQKGCISYDTIVIFEIHPIEGDLESEVEIDLGETTYVKINPYPDEGVIDRIQWYPSSYLTCDTCLETGIYPPRSMDYKVHLVDTNGCDLWLTIFVKVNLPKIYVPNVFSPGNSDQINDRFFPFTNLPDQVTVDRMEIFSRWGELVFVQTHFPPNIPEWGWDGSFRDERMNAAVFAYVISGSYSNGQQFVLSGSVTLLE